MNKEIEERVKANIISCISPRNYLKTLAQKLVKTDNSVDETYSIKKVNIDKCINVISDEWLKKYCFDVFHDDRYNRRGVHMMTKEEYEKKIAELQAQIDELKITQIEEMPTPPHPRWKPERGKLYYTINVGYACAGFNTWDSDTVDGDIYSLGFVFKTEAEAEFALERLKVLAEMREWAGKWGDTYAIACVKVMSEETRIIVNDKLSTISNGEMRFATEEDAEGCIKAVGADRIKKYYFMIPEEANND